MQMEKEHIFIKAKVGRVFFFFFFKQANFCMSWKENKELLCPASPSANIDKEESLKNILKSHTEERKVG